MTAFKDLEFLLWTMHWNLQAKFVAKKSGKVAPLKRTLRDVRVALYDLQLSVMKPITKFPSPRSRILLATTASAPELKGLPAVYRGMLRDTYKLGQQLERASKRSVKSKQAVEIVDGLQSKYKRLLAAVERR